MFLCSLDNIQHVLKEVSERNIESPSLVWIVVVLTEDAIEILRSLLREGFQVVIVQAVSLNSFKILSSKIDEAGLFRFQDSAIWVNDPNRSNPSGMEDVFADLEASYSNFGGRQLLVAANDNNPFIVLQKVDYEEGLEGLEAVAGFEYSLLESLSRALNFTYRMVTPEDGQWGGPLPNGTVVGMIGEVYKRNAHFAICEITITGLRETVIDFSYPYYIESLTLISRTPREKNRTFAAFSPFSALVWLCLAAMVLLMGPLLLFQLWVMEDHLARSELQNLSDLTFTAFSTLLKQTNNLGVSEHWPQNLTFLFWYIFCLIISVLYSGMLTATLIIPSFEKPINSLSDLPKAVEDGFALVVTDGTSDQYMFKNAREGIYADTWRLFDHEDPSRSFVPHPIYAIDRMLEQKLVLINGILGARYLSMRRGIRKYHFARDHFASQYYGVACIPGSPFIQTFNKMFSYMVEGGLISKWVDDEFEKVSGNNTDSQKTGPRAFNIKHLQAAFYIILIGYSAGVVTLIIEQAV